MGANNGLQVLSPLPALLQRHELDLLVLGDDVIFYCMHFFCRFY